MRRSWQKVRLAWQRSRRFLAYRVLRVDDTPHRIALSIAIGAFVSWIPAPGLQMALTLLLCTLLRANKFAGLAITWLSNPITIGPMLYAGYVVGAWLAPGSNFAGQAQWHDLAITLSHPDLSLKERLSGLGDWAADVALPMWLGTLVLGLASGILSYALAYVAISRYRRREAAESARKPEPSADKP